MKIRITLFVMRAIVLTCLRQSAIRPFDRLRDLGLSLWGAAAGIGRGVEPTGVFGWVTGDRLRRVCLLLHQSIEAVM